MLLKDIRIQEPISIQLRIYDKLDVTSFLEGYQAASYGYDDCNKIECRAVTSLLISCTNHHIVRSLLHNQDLSRCEVRFFPSRIGKPIVVCIDECETNKCN